MPRPSPWARRRLGGRRLRRRRLAVGLGLARRRRCRRGLGRRSWSSVVAFARSALAFGSAFAFVSAFALRRRLGLRLRRLASAPTASFAASSASLAACVAAASSRRSRSVLASCSAFCAALAALLPPNVMSAMRRTVSSWRWPFLTRLRALGRYLNEMSFGPRVWSRTSALTAASATSGRPIDDSSPSATSRTRSMVIVLPGSTSSSSTSSSVPTSTRYCFPPVSMTAYMDPQDGCLATACGDRDLGREKARGDADAQNKDCTALSVRRSTVGRSTERDRAVSRGVSPDRDDERGAGARGRARAPLRRHQRDDRPVPRPSDDPGEEGRREPRPVDRIASAWHRSPVRSARRPGSGVPAPPT